MAAYRLNVRRISRYEWDISELPGETAIIEVQKHVRASANTPTSGWVIYQRWQPVAGSGYGMTFISACIHDSNEIPTGIRVFLASNTITGLIRILFHIRVWGIYHFQLQATIFDIPLTQHRTLFTQLQSFAWSQNSWNFCAVSHSCATRYFICTSSSRPPSLISRSPRQAAVFISVQSFCLTLKT